MSDTNDRFRRQPAPEERAQAAEHNRLLALPFHMVIEDVLKVKGHGTALIGRIGTGILRERDTIVIQGDGLTLYTSVQRLEMRGRGEDPVTRWAGDNVGIFLPMDVMGELIKPGMIVTKQDKS